MPSPHREKGERAAPRGGDPRTSANANPTRPEPAIELGKLRDTFAPRRRAHWAALIMAVPIVVATLSTTSKARVLAVDPHAVPASWIVLGTTAGLSFLAYFTLAFLRGRSVLLYESGLVIQSKRKRETTLFADVDEVWWQIAVRHGSVAELATIDAIRLKKHDGTWHQVPLRVERPVDLVNAIVRKCSFPLHAEALRMLERDQLLTFAKVHLDGESIGTDDWTLAWSEISRLVFFSARVGIFRRKSQQLVPWRTIDLSDVPHPTIFLACVRECANAKKVPLEEPTPAWADVE